MHRYCLINSDLTCCLTSNQGGIERKRAESKTSQEDLGSEYFEDIYYNLSCVMDLKQQHHHHHHHHVYGYFKYTSAEAERVSLCHEKG